MILDRKQFCLLMGSALSTLLGESTGTGQQRAGNPAGELALREDKGGWIYLTLTGAPHDRGYQHGYALAPEIDDAFAALQLGITHHHGSWATYREAAHQLFWSRLDPEYQQELSGIADGLKARGFNYDVQDVLAYNSHIEIGDYYLPAQHVKKTGALLSKAPLACSAFVATGKQTADGKVVMAHN